MADLIIAQGLTPNKAHNFKINNKTTLFRHDCNFSTLLSFNVLVTK